MPVLSFVDKFKLQVCDKVCRLCKTVTETDPNPVFCSVVYANEPSRFMRAVTFMLAVRKSNPAKYYNFVTFPGFCGLFCNSDVCPQKSNRCKDTRQVIACYSTFCEQMNSPAQTNTITSINNSFSGIPVTNIGAEYKIVENVIYLNINKRDRRDLKKTARSIRKALGKSVMDSSEKSKAKEKKEKKQKKEVITGIFYNDNDPQWVEIIERILGVNLKTNDTKINNRQPINIEGNSS